MGSLTIDNALFTVRNNIDNTTGRTSANYNVTFAGGSMAGVAILDWARNVQSNIVSTGSSTGPGTAAAPSSRLTIAGNITGAAGSEFYKNGESTLVFGSGATDTVASDWLTDITLTAGTTYLNKADDFSAINGNITLNGGNLTAGTESALTGVGANQIADTSLITVNAGTVNFLGRNETIGSLVMNGGMFRTDTDTTTGLTGNKVTIAGNATINAVGDNGGLIADNATVLSIGGNLTVGEQARVLANSSGTVNVGGQRDADWQRRSASPAAVEPVTSASVARSTTLAHGQAAVFDGQDDSDSFLNLNAAAGSRIFNVADGLATDDLIVSVKVRDGSSGVDGSGTTTGGFKPQRYHQRRRRQDGPAWRLEQPLHRRRNSGRRHTRTGEDCRAELHQRQRTRHQFGCACPATHPQIKSPIPPRSPTTAHGISTSAMRPTPWAKSRAPRPARRFV